MTRAKTQKRKYVKMFPVMLTEEQFDVYEQVASDKGCSIAELIRTATDKYIHYKSK